jgi:hypothetical protein
MASQASQAWLAIFLLRRNTGFVEPIPIAKN